MKPRLLLLVPVVLAFAQEPEPFRGGLSLSAPRFTMEVVVGAPYSGEKVVENDQSLADGTHVRNSTSSKVWRDSAGRVRAEWPLRSTNPDSQATLTMVQISDPAAHSLYVLDSVNKVAHRQELKVSAEPLGPRPVRTPPDAAALQPRHSSGKVELIFEDLGNRSMEGLIVEGSRDTTIRPVGEMGNDHPMTEVNETWKSPELRLVVYQRRTGPMIGEVINKLTNIGRNEPDAALFQVPPDYTVVDEAGGFTLNWGQ